MARVTVEDCIDKIPNRFELVMLAAQRARDIAAGASLTLDRDNDKNPVVALREIADQKFLPEDLREALIRGMQLHAEVDAPAEETMDMPSADLSEIIADAASGGLGHGMHLVDADDEIGEELDLEEEAGQADLEAGAEENS